MKKSLKNTKKNKSAEDNQWISLPRGYFEKETSNKQEKTAIDNQWTSTNKNNMTQQ